MTKTMGIDVSLNHAGLILLEDGELKDLFYVTDIKGSADKSKKRSAYMPISKMAKEMEKDRHRINAWRLREMAYHVWSAVHRWEPDYVAIEDYALRAEQGSHQMGEIGGTVRYLLFSAGVPFRLHDPMSLKMFVAHDGTASKEDVQEAVEERWGIQFYKFDSGASRKGEPNRQTSEDLADAYGLAQMAWIEDQVRRGVLRLDELHMKEIRVFNRITKYQPVPLISRNWVQK